MQKLSALFKSNLITQLLLSFWILLLAIGCQKTTSNQPVFLSDKPPTNIPILFKPELIPKNQLIHRGVFSNDLNAYYFTISDTNFARFDIKVSVKQNGEWSQPNDAFFNSQYSEHGISFSPDGNKLLFSSTRPVGDTTIAETWHLWESTKRDDKWSDPEFIKLSGFDNKLTSHPAISNDGTLYFHSSEPDYSNMWVYQSRLIDGEYQVPQKLTFNGLSSIGACTPYISSDGKILIFASINKDGSLPMYFCRKLATDEWSKPELLSKEINQNSQGNPYLTPDNQFLFYAKEINKNKWSINWVNTDSFLQ